METIQLEVQLSDPETACHPAPTLFCASTVHARPHAPWLSGHQAPSTSSTHQVTHQPAPIRPASA